MGVSDCWKPDEVGYSYFVSLALAAEQSLHKLIDNYVKLKTTVSCCDIIQSLHGTNPASAVCCPGNVANVTIMNIRKRLA